MVLSGSVGIAPTSGNATVVTFSRPMSSGSVLSTSGIFLTVSGQASFQTTGHISGSYSMDATGQIVTFTPYSGTLNEATWYIPYATAAGVQAANGVFLASPPSIYSGAPFQTVLNATVSGVLPISGQTGISGGQIFTFTFSNNMMASTINTSGIFVVKSGQASFLTTGHISGTIVLSGGTAVKFTPNSGQLTAGNWYQTFVTSACSDVFGVSISGGSIISGNAVQMQPAPVVSGTIPVSGTTNTPTNQGVLITFSQAMKASTITISGIYVVISGQASPTTTGHISGTVTLLAPPSNNLGSFIPANASVLANSTWYIPMINTNCQDFYNNPLQALTSGGPFQTAAGAPAVVVPQVSGTNPVSGSTGVISNINPTITMNTPVTSASVTTTSIKLRDTTAAVDVTMATSIMSDLVTLVINPAPNNLINGHVHKIEVSGLIAVEDGSTVQSPAFSGSVFTVESGIFVQTQTPSSGTSGVLVNVNPTLYLSRDTVGPVNTSSVSLVLVSHTLSAVAITVSLMNDNQTVIMSPVSNLFATYSNAVPGEYRITMSGAQDAAGAFMAPWSGLNDFYTQGAPAIASTSPVSGASSVDAGTTVTVVMTSGVDPTTVNTNTVILNPVGGVVGVGVAATVTLGADNKTITLDPTSNLSDNTAYGIDASGIQDLNGAFMVHSSGVIFTTAAPALTQFFNAGSNSTSLVLGHGNNMWVGEKAGTSNSILIGRKPRQSQFALKRTGNPTGTVYSQVRDTNNVIKATLGSMDVGSVATSFTTYIFTNLNASYTLATGGKITVEFSGGDSSNYISTIRNGKQPAGQANVTYLAYFGNSESSQPNTDVDCILWY